MQTLVTRSRDAVLTVSELNRAARSALEGSLPLLWVAGEVSGFVRHGSGHCYFTLKDRDAQVGCVMFRHRALQLASLPENGMRVEVLALATLYEPRGQFQLNVETLRRGGVGTLFEAFERLKAKLKGEGLFDAARKRPLPPLPRAVGVVTSRDGAALRDFLTTLARRMPGIAVRVYPTPVQGEGAAARIAAAIRTAGGRLECDVLVVCRGGGSIEDLWAFNDEGVARAIVASPLPVVTGIGHETDFTIADFVADLRAPTPSAAAEMVVGRKDEFLARLAHQQNLLGRRLEKTLHSGRTALWELLDDTALPRFPGRVMEREQRLDNLDFDMHRRLTEGIRTRSASLARQGETLARLDLMRRVEGGRLRAERAALAQQASWLALLGGRQQALSTATAVLEARGPEQVLARGYSITTRGTGEVVRDASDLSGGETLHLRFHRGGAQVVVAKEEG
jgi:exodeoxyribonuclease VII large subunit